MAKRALICLLLFFVAANASAKARFIIRNTNAAGEGFNDPTPAQPIGGNPGTTLGEQRMKSFEYAANLWGDLLDSPVDIVIEAKFTKLDCSSTSAVLGSARATNIVRNFDNAPKPNTWYVIALANKFAGRDLNSGNAHIFAQFNSALDTGCLSGVKWYYGLDGNHGTDEDLIVVLLHEMGHGFGFIGGVDLETGALAQGIPTIFETHILDNSSGLRWDQMTDSQRKTSALNDQQVVWDGESARNGAAKLLAPTPFLTITSPSAIANTYRVGTATFGASINVAGVNGNIVAAKDDSNADGPTTTDGCTAFTNASEVIGKMALIDRGTCTFVTKVKNAQNAGAIGVIIVDNRVATSPPGMGGADTTITIPVASVVKSDGDSIRLQTTSVISARLFADPQKLAGADGNGFVKLYAPSTLEKGSSIYHWDTSATPNLLMEPAINPDLKHNVDITLNHFIDIGWSTSQTPVPGRRALRRGR